MNKVLSKDLNFEITKIPFMIENVYDRILALENLALESIPRDDMSLKMFVRFRKIGPNEPDGISHTWYAREISLKLIFALPKAK